MMKIKVCGMREAANIVEVAALGIDYMGFIFYPKSPRFVNEKIEINIPDTVKKVGVFVNENIQTIINTVEKYHLDVIQLHGSETPSEIFGIRRTISDLGDWSFEHRPEIWKAFGVSQIADFGQMEAYENVCDKFLFDTKTPQHGGSGLKFDWTILEKVKIKKPFFLSGGISEEDKSTIKNLNIENFYGVDLNSKFEISPAVKNIDMLRSFLA